MAELFISFGFDAFWPNDSIRRAPANCAFVFETHFNNISGRFHKIEERGARYLRVRLLKYSIRTVFLVAQSGTPVAVVGISNAFDKMNWNMNLEETSSTI